MRENTASNNTHQHYSSLERLFSDSPLSNLLEAVPCVLFTFQLSGNRSGIIPYSSNKLTDIVGLEPRDVALDAAPFLDLIHPDDIDTFFASAKQSLHTKELWHLEFRISQPSGNVIWLEWRATPSQQNRELLWQGVMLDITERKRMEDKLRSSEKAFRDLAENSPDFIIHYDLEHRIRYINAKLVRELRLTSADEVYGCHPDEIWPDGRFSLIGETARKVIDTGDKTTIELEVPQSDGAINFHQVLIAPKYDPDGNIIGTMIYGRDITTIRENERRLQYIVDNLPGVIGTFRLYPDGQGTFPYFSPGVEKMCGLMPEQAQEDMMAILDCVHPDDLAHIKAAIAESARTLKPVHLEYRISPTGKTERCFEMRSSPERQPDGTILWTGIMIDITERKQAELKMRRLQHAVDVSADSIFIVGRETRFVDVNEAACHSLGYSREELLNKTPLDIDPDITQEQMKQMIEGCHAGQVIRIETRHRARDGHIFPVEIIISPFYEEGKVHALNVVRDITKRKQTEQAMQRLQHAVNASTDSIFITDDQQRFVDVNTSACNLLGYNRDELLGKTALDINPDATAEQLAQLAAKGNHGQSITLETRHRTRDGHIFPVEVVSAPFFEEEKQYAISVVRDITERKQNEEQLRMAASVFETAREGIVITDPEGHILDVNPAFTDITGYTREEVTGKSPNILASGQHNQEFYRAMWSQLKTEGTWSGEITNRRKAGELYTEELNIVAVYDEEDRVKHYIGIFSDISVLKKQERHLQHIAYHDTLTSLPNRLSLTNHLSRSMPATRKQDKMLAILYLDLDGFKPINDHHGQEVGDCVLVTIAHRLMESLRENDTISRIGGDEFVIVLGGVSDSEECERTANRLLDIVAMPITIDGHEVNLTASIGIYLHPEHTRYDADTLLRYADQAMSHAKSAGRNQFAFYESDSRNDTNNEQKVYDLRMALAEEQISVHYQPIIDAVTGMVVKAEALVRWHHPTLGMVPPSEFIPIAENVGLIHDIGDLVFRHAARVACIWNNRYTKEIDQPRRISVNRSARQFFHRNGVEAWVRYLDEQNIPGELLSVEITESLLLDNLSNVMQQLAQLRKKGMDILLDDFGAGYSTLSYLKKFNIDYLKIDRSFVKDLVGDPDYQAVIKSIIAMANQLGIKIIGEGIETPEQAELLQEFGCDLMQGFLYARPMPEDEFLDFVATGPVKQNE